MTHSALPWKQFGHGDMWVGSDEPAVGYSYGGAVANCEMDSQGYAKSAANAAYIVKACNAYPDLIFALKEIRAAIKETADSDSDELLLMLDGIARDGLAGNVLTSPQESGSSRSAVSDGVDP